MIVCIMVGNYANGQALRGTTGLLHAPTAEMQADGTFMMGANVLDLVPLHYYTFNNEITHTFNYYFNITFFSFLEIGYTCTLNYAVHGSSYFPEFVWGTYSNQDRSFYARVRLWKDGWWKSWTPQVVFGMDDPASHTRNGGGSITVTDGTMYDNHFTRYYLAFTKHFLIPDVGNIGAHFSWIWNYGHGAIGSGSSTVNLEYFSRPSAGVNFRFSLPEENGWLRALNGLDLLAEYDARTFNLGFRYNLFKDRMHVIFELNDFKYCSGGVYWTIGLMKKQK